jgi:hypothetical protein
LDAARKCDQMIGPKTRGQPDRAALTIQALSRQMFSDFHN